VQLLVIVGAVALLLGGGLGFWLGDGMADGRCAQRELVVANAYASNQNAAVEATNRAAEAERKRAVSAASARSRKAAAAQEVIHETVADPGPADCEWRPAQRLRIETLYRTYGADSQAGAARVPDPVPAATPGDGAS